MLKKFDIVRIVHGGVNIQRGRGGEHATYIAVESKALLKGNPANVIT